MALSEILVPKTTVKVRAHQTQNEALLFEISTPGKYAYKLPPLDVPAVDAAALLGASYRETKRGVARNQRDRNHSPLHASLHLELCD